MKKINLMIIVLLCICMNVSANTWTQKANVGGSIRREAVGFSIGNKGYIGTGWNGSLPAYLDFWEYDPATNSWTQKANFGGSARYYAVGFSIGTNGYIGTGFDGAYKNDFWEYNSITNVWTKKANFGGSARLYAVGFSIGNKGYIGTGKSSSVTNLQDFWEYDPATDAWTQKANFSGVARQRGVGFSIGSRGYIGVGYSGNTSLPSYRDFWEYNPATDTWYSKADYGGSARFGAVGFSIGSKGYLGTGNDGSYEKDFWEYDPSTNSWSQQTDFGGTARVYSLGFSVGSKGYIGTGNDGANLYDFWEYSTCSLTKPSVSASSSTTFCQGGNVELTCNPNGSVYTYQWFLNGNAINGDTNCTYKAKQTGSFTIKIDSANCSETSNAINVKVNPLPIVSVTIAPTLNIQTNLVSLNGTPSGGTFAGAGVTGANFYPNSAGLGVKIITYSYTDNNGCSNSANTSTIVYDTITCYVIDTNYITITDTDYVTITDTDYVTITDTDYVTITDTTYTVVTDTLIINAKLTGVNPPNNINTIKVYPNPAKDHITIDFGNYPAMNGYTLKINNSLGQIVYFTLINYQSSNIDLSSWTGKGLYYINILDKQGKLIDKRKIVLQ